MLLTRSFSHGPTPTDEVELWAHLHERVLRELRYRSDHPEEYETVIYVEFAETKARDVGDICRVCGDVVTWTDHLPGEDEVRCMKNVVLI